MEQQPKYTHNNKGLQINNIYTYLLHIKLQWNYNDDIHIFARKKYKLNIWYNISYKAQ